MLIKLQSRSGVLPRIISEKNVISTNLGYYPWIDVLRAACFLNVVVTHAGYPGWWGAMGVSLFFAISGWLITEIILRDLSKDNFLAYFYSRRLLRIYPAYIVALVFYGCLVALGLQSNSPLTINNFLETLPLFLTFNYDLHPVPGMVFAHAWSICVEERFYLIWPAICLLCWKLKIRLVWILAFGIFTVVIAPLVTPENYESLWHKLPAPLLFGCLLAIVGSNKRVLSSRLRWVVALGCLTLLCILGNSGMILYGPVPGLLAAVVVWALAGKSALPKVLTPLTTIGKLSYGAYLIHIPFASAALRLLKPFGLQMMAPILAATTTILAAKLLYQLVESPALDARKSLNYSPSFSKFLACFQICLIPVGVLWMLYKY